jgi:hypothetical protein
MNMHLVRVKKMDLKRKNKRKLLKKTNRACRDRKKRNGHSKFAETVKLWALSGRIWRI